LPKSKQFKAEITVFLPAANFGKFANQISSKRHRLCCLQGTNLKAVPPKNFTDLQQSPRDLARWQQAQQDFLGGRYVRAADGYRDLLAKFPDTAGVWFELGLATAKLLDFDQAVHALQRTVELSPGDVSMLVLVGQQFHALRRLELARDCFERAVAAQPASLHALLSLADWYERERHLDQAWACVQICAAHHPGHPQVACVQALLLHRLQRNTEAENLLRDIIQGPAQDLNVRYSSRHQLAVLLDATGRHAEALRWLREAKDVLRQSANVPRLEQDYDRGDHRRRALLAALTPDTIRRWREERKPDAEPQRLAFLGGHPRSGTTLLEQILGAHPSLTAFDEPPAFVEEVAEKLAPLSSPVALTLKNLDNLSAPLRTHYRHRYHKSLLRGGRPAPETAVLLDKNPSPTALLHQWLRIFPELKVIIALRDPRDVLISTYFLNVRLNPTSANFLSLERTARHYSDLMDVWLRLRDLGGFDWIESRYEDVVANMETEGRRVTQFLGLDWHPHQAIFHQRARREFVYSPTYNAVTQPVHNRALGRWKNYAEALEPLEAKLAPYCRAFGYA